MTVNRNIYADQQATKAILAGSSSIASLVQARPNWLGHTGGCANIDAALIQGATLSQMQQYRGAVKEHIRHLKVEHGLTVDEVNGVFRLS